MSRFLFPLILIAFTGCTTLYKPQGPKEEMLFRDAKRDVSPPVFRQNPEKYLGQTIAWTGIIKKFEAKPVDREKKVLGMFFVVEERPFSWTWTTRSALPAGYLVSSTGSGDFNARLAIQGDNSTPSLEQMKKESEEEFRPGDFVVLYGEPKLDKTKSLLFDATYARTIESSQWFTEKSNF